MGEGLRGDLRGALAAAADADDGTPERLQARLDAACRLIVALVDDLADAEADAVIAETLLRAQHDAQLEIELRRRLARELVTYERYRAVVQLGAALETAQALGLVVLEAELAEELRAAMRDEGGTSTLRTTSSALAEASRAANPELAARMQLSLSASETGAIAEQHARTSVELARASGEIALLHEATTRLAELLAERGELAEAKAILLALPTHAHARESKALLDEIRRRLEEPVVDPPEVAETLVPLDPQLRAFATRPHNLVQSVVDGGLLGADKIREWSSGEITKPADLESQLVFGPVRSYWCACGRYRGRHYAGIVCKRCGVEVIDAAARRTRTGHITLREPVVHPWYAPAAALLLDLPLAQLTAVPPFELHERLLAFDAARLDHLVDELKYAIVTAPKARVADAAGRRLALVEAFRTAAARTFTQPASIVLALVPVLPPNVDLPIDRVKVRDAYAQILEAPARSQAAAVTGLFGALAAR